jgi:hypothetical protein
MLARTRRALIALVALAGTASAVGAQQPAAPAGPRVGDMAPDFSLGGATRYGILRDPVTLSSYRGHTVVLAFFFKARTRG